MKAILKYKNHKIEIKNIKECQGINKFIGLMFKPKNTEALLFEFSKPISIKIHSLFCKPFLAIWLDENNKIIEVKIIDKIGTYKPKKQFSKILEVPLNKNYNKVIQFFLGKEKV